MHHKSSVVVVYVVVVVVNVFRAREVLVTALLFANDVAPECVAIAERTLAVNRKEKCRTFVTSGFSKVFCQTNLFSQKIKRACFASFVKESIDKPYLTSGTLVVVCLGCQKCDLKNNIVSFTYLLPFTSISIILTQCRKNTSNQSITYLS